MFLRRVWLGSVAAAVLAASAPAQEPLDIDAYVGIVLRAHPRAAQMRAVENLAAAERRAAGGLARPDSGSVARTRERLSRWPRKQRRMGLRNLPDHSLAERAIGTNESGRAIRASHVVE